MSRGGSQRQAWVVDVSRGSETRGIGEVVGQTWVVDGVSQAEVPRREAEAWS